ncbi:hypothetical protein BJV78DRAFT_1230343 [Lactifluus subvellereus]|nr:hypothetical protein BJV78DRAFT_1230343 [Lactifluus subvellereus]
MMVFSLLFPTVASARVGSQFPLFWSASQSKVFSTTPLRSPIPQMGACQLSNPNFQRTNIPVSLQTLTLLSAAASLACLFKTGESRQGLGDDYAN